MYLSVNLFAYILFAASNLDFEVRKIKVPFARVTL